MNEPSVFTKIINGEIPAYKVYKDDTSVVILTNEPLSPGHCLVIPRQQVDHLWNIDDELYQHLMSVTKLMAHRLKNAYSYERVGMIVEGYGVPHAHIHVFGYEQPLNQTIIDYAAHKYEATTDELRLAANKLKL